MLSAGSTIFRICRAELLLSGSNQINLVGRFPAQQPWPIIGTGDEVALQLQAHWQGSAVAFAGPGPLAATNGTVDSRTPRGASGDRDNGPGATSRPGAGRALRQAGRRLRRRLMGPLRGIICRF
jgi:hypothetical protein